jgi:hypothetical protein
MLALWIAALLAPAQEDKELAELRTALAAWHDDAWTRVLAPDAELLVRLIGAVNDANGRGDIVSANVGHSGRDAVKAALAELYRDQDPKVSFDAAARSGSEALLHGEVSVTGPDGLRRAYPLCVKVKFDDSRRIRQMTLTAVHARPGPPPAK